LTALCFFSLFGLIIIGLRPEHNTGWCSHCSSALSLTTDVIVFIVGFNCSVLGTKLITSLAAQLCGVGKLRNLSIFISMLSVNYAMLAYWPTVLEESKGLFVLLVCQESSVHDILTGVYDPLKVCKELSEAVPLYSPSLAGSFRGLFSGELSLDSFVLYTSSSLPSIIGFVLSIIFVGSFLAKPILLRPVSVVWARIVQSQKPVFTLTFGGMAAFTSAITEAVKHL
jgi:hypothetical protein